MFHNNLYQNRHNHHQHHPLLLHRLQEMDLSKNLYLLGESARESEWVTRVEEALRKVSKDVRYVKVSHLTAQLLLSTSSSPSSYSTTIGDILTIIIAFIITMASKNTLSPFDITIQVQSVRLIAILLVVYVKDTIRSIGDVMVESAPTGFFGVVVSSWLWWRRWPGCSCCYCSCFDH